MEKTGLLNTIGQLRKKEKRSSTRLKRALSIVNHSVDQRKKIFLEQKSELETLVRARRKNLERFTVVERNMIIYRKNLEKIDALLEENSEQKKELKQKYDDLLKGSVSTVIEFAGEYAAPDEGINTPGNEGAYILTRLKKESLIKSMDNLFQRYEDEIAAKEREAGELLDKRRIISGKLEAAQNHGPLLLEGHDSYTREVKRAVDSLRLRKKELRGILFIYEGIVRRLRLSSLLPKESRPVLMKEVGS